MDVDRPSWGSTLVKNHDENKTYILVKLSESFSNAIQEYSAEPTIKFFGTRGVIRFRSEKSYDFTIEQSDNSVECIKQTKNKWETVGKIVYCLHVKGKDDVYQRTRTKMEAAEREKRKYCTKLLGSPKNNSSSSAAPQAATAATTMTTATTTTATITASSTKQQHTITPLSKYPDITDVKQLKRYKADFDQDFKEYQNLHGYLHRIEERFKNLRELLKQSVEGSPEWESAKEQIFNEYERVKGDSNFHRARSKYKQLYNKLAHIKEKIFQFKRQRKDKFNNTDIKKKIYQMKRQQRDKFNNNNKNISR